LGTVTCNSTFEHMTGSDTGDDALFGDIDRNVLDGGTGAGNDLLVGNSGNDVLIGREGNDTYEGDSGADTVDFEFASQGVTADLSLGFATGEGDDTLIAFDIEILKGSDFGDTFTGGLTFFGGAANLIFKGRGGNDLLTGSAGNDTLKGAKGNDILRAGPGDDTLKGGKGKKDKGFGGPGTDICKGIEEEHGCEV